MFAEIIEILDAEMAEPALYGWFHNLWLLITVGMTVLLCKLFQKSSAHRVCTIVLAVAVAVILLEIYKQISFTFSSNGEKVTSDYQWYAFPFQFCSTPMYIGLLAGIVRKGKVHHCLMSYLATYAVFAGAAVMLYPADVFIETIGINIQTMVCHGSMVCVGIALLYSGYVNVEYKTILKALPVFATMVALAAVMNEIAYFSGLTQRETFNMFFISRHFPSTLPVYGAVHNAVPFPVNFLIYIAGFTAAAFAILLLAIGCRQLAPRLKKQTVSI